MPYPRWHLAFFIGHRPASVYLMGALTAEGVLGRYPGARWLMMESAPTLLVPLASVFLVLWGIVQSYAVVKTNSIWVAAFLHGVVNSVYAFILQYVIRPDEPMLSFGLGGLACLAVVVLAILRDPIWHTAD